MLSMASITKSGLWPSAVQGASWASAVEPTKSSFRQSKCVQGVICSRRLRRQCTFGVPTSASVATACLFREDRVTWSKSMIRSFPAPDLARAAAAWEPTPPTPTMMMNALRSFFRPSSVRKTRLRASCSRISSISCQESCSCRLREVPTFIVVSQACSCSKRSASLIFF